MQFQALAAIMGDYEGARLVHFFAMADRGPVVVVHVVMVLLVPRTFPTMITGRVRGGRHEATRHDGNASPTHPARRSRASSGACSSGAGSQPRRARACSRAATLTDGEGVQKVLWAMSRWNDRVQAWLFDPNRLAPEYPESAITVPFPFNAYYGEDEVRKVDAVELQARSSPGSFARRKPWTLPELYALPQVSQITRHICVEGWSAIGKWSGVRFSDVPRSGSAPT